MDQFRTQVLDAITRYATGQRVPTNAAISLMDNIHAAVKQAIDTAGFSPEIDTMLVRTMLGKSGTRYLSAAEQGDKRVEYRPGPEVEVFCRVYAIERSSNAAFTAAIERACAAVAKFSAVAELTVPHGA